MLKNAGYVEAPAQGIWRLTPAGKELLAKYPRGFDDDVIRRIARESRIDEIQGGPPQPLSTDQTPEERIEGAIEEMNAALAKDLLQRIAQAPPAFFEHLVLGLLYALGYGGSTSDAVQHVGRSGDGGIDGVISLDRLGLEKVYVQAKR